MSIFSRIILKTSSTGRPRWSSSSDLFLRLRLKKINRRQLPHQPASSRPPAPSRAGTVQPVLGPTASFGIRSRTPRSTSSKTRTSATSAQGWASRGFPIRLKIFFVIWFRFRWIGNILKLFCFIALLMRSKCLFCVKIAKKFANRV